jgi:hypothetical protein
MNIDKQPLPRMESTRGSVNPMGVSQGGERILPLSIDTESRNDALPMGDSQGGERILPLGIK